MIHFKHILPVLFLFLAVISKGQSPFTFSVSTIHSLADYTFHFQDTVKANELLAIAEQLNKVNIAITYNREGSVDSSLLILDQVAPLAYKNFKENQGLIISMHIAYGHTYQLLHDDEQTIYHYKKAIDAADVFPVKKAKAYSNLGSLYLQAEDYDESIDQYNSALAILEDQQTLNENPPIL